MVNGLWINGTDFTLEIASIVNRPGFAKESFQFSAGGWKAYCMLRVAWWHGGEVAGYRETGAEIFLRANGGRGGRGRRLRIFVMAFLGLRR